ncbi:MAG: hypothetical protein SV760_02590 [Halobacteria archaeon]|nr:hypothetical protein [Halobacteria archaeon]
MSVVALALLLLLSVPTLAQSGSPTEVSESNVDLRSAVVDIDGNRAVIELDFDSNVALKLNTILFGSDDLEKSLSKILNVDDPEFRSLSSSSGVVVVGVDASDFGSTKTALSNSGTEHRLGQEVESLVVKRDGHVLRRTTDTEALGFEIY